MIRRWRERLASRDGQNMLSLYGVQAAHYIFPTVLMLYLARVLGPEVWGLVILVQAFNIYLGMIVEYGFDLSATRAGAAIRDDRDKLADLLAGVLGARLLLLVLVLAIALIVQPLVPVFRDAPAIFWGGVLFGVTFSADMMWFFRAIEHVRPAAIIEITGRAAGTGLVLLLVRGPEDAWLVLTLLGLGNLGGLLAAMALAGRYTVWRKPTRTRIRRVLIDGRRLFVYRCISSAQESGGPVLLGFLAGPVTVAFFAAPEKLARALFRLSEPAIKALFPRVARLRQARLHSAASLTRASLMVMTGAATVVAAIAFLAAPLIVRLLLGERFGPATDTMRVLCLLVPLMTVNQIVGVQWMVPNGLERDYTRVTLGAILVTLVVAILLVPLLQPAGLAHLGMAWAVVIAEAMALGGLQIVLLRRHVHPVFSGRLRRPVPTTVSDE